MAKPRIPNQRKANVEHKKRVERYAVLIQQVYDKVAKEAARYAELSGARSDEAFSFEDYPMAKVALNRLMSELVSDVRTIIMAGTSEEWKQSNLVQDLVARKVLTAYIGTNRFGEEFTRYFQTNPESLKAFQQRKDEGMNLSSRVWNLSEQYKTELEESITAAIAPGTSAVELAAEMKKYLKEPDKRFRRIKEKMEDGTIKWHLSNPAKAYHPGRGVYRSSARNAQRLARTEINMAYRTAEQIRWRQFDFVVGYEVKTTQNGHHVEDICDQLSGKYPKDFVFKGWHPACMCYTIPILKTEEEFWSLDEDKTSINEISDVPNNFKEWVADNSVRIEKASERGTLPYFIKDNREVVDAVMSEGEEKRKAEKAERERIEANRRVYERLKDDPNYTGVEFNPENGGFKATHRGHIVHSSKKEPTFFGDENLTSTQLELECQNEIFECGGKCILLEEGKILQKGMILPALDANINDCVMDIRSITTLKDQYGAAIMAKIKQLKRYNAAYGSDLSDLCLYFHDPRMYSDGCIERGFRWIEEKIGAEELLNLKRVFVVVRGRKEIITIKMHGS